MPKEKITTIKVETATKKRLDGLKEHKRETYNEVINKIFDIINISIRNPVAGARIFRSIKQKKTRKEMKNQLRRVPKQEGLRQFSPVYQGKPVQNLMQGRMNRV